MVDNKPKKVFIIAGEDSGDILAAGMMKELNHNAKVEYFGIGGSLMRKEGLKKSFFPMKELSIMGLDIVPKIPFFLKKIKETVDEIIRINPDLVITVDAPEFSFRVLKQLRKKNKNIKLVHYVSPSVWAWREGRAKKISKYLDALLLLWPFEKKYYPNIKTFYVGHPATMKFKKAKELKSNKILCLPGSRRKEIESLFPIFIEAINTIYKKDKSISVAIPVANHVKDLVKEMSKKLEPKVELILDDKKKELANGKVALCASGTAVFELSLKEIPTISAYKMGAVASLAAKLLVKTKWATLPNIIMQKEIVPEYMNKNCKLQDITKKLDSLLHKDNAREKQIKDFQKMKAKLGVGKICPDTEAGKAIAKLLK